MPRVMASPHCGSVPPILCVVSLCVGLIDQTVRWPKNCGRIPFCCLWGIIFD